jgi:ABC-2 type transport system permease protein
MDPSGIWISFYTIVRKDVIRMVRVWPQTFLPAAVTALLYFLIFGAFLGDRIGSFGEIPFIAFVVPGLIMLQVITNSFSNVAFVMFSSKFFNRNIDEIMVSPTPPWVIVAGFVSAGVVRGVITAVLVLGVAAFFTEIRLANVAVMILFLLLASIALSLAGLINGVYAKSFDGISIVPTFVLTPLIYLGGIFYSVDILPDFWRALTFANPLFYIVDGFRYGFLGVADVPLGVSLGVLVAITAVLATSGWYVIRRGLGLRQ